MISVSMLPRTRFLSPDDGGGTPPPPAPAKVATYIDKLIQRHGTAEAALAVIAPQVLGYSEQAETDARTIADLKTKLPAPDAVVLPPERAKQFNAFEMLKLTPEQVTETLTERDALKGKIADTEREKVSRDAAVAAGFDPEAMVDLARIKGLHVEMRETELTEQGKPVKKSMPHVRPAADEKASLELLTIFAGKLPAHEQRALKAVASPSNGTPYPVQHPTERTADTPSTAALSHVRSLYPTPSEARAKQGA